MPIAAPRKSKIKIKSVPSRRENSDTGMQLRDLLHDAGFQRRKKRTRSGSREAEAYRALARVFAEAPGTILQSLVDTATAYCGADSAGISLEETGDNGQRQFRWVAISGSFAGFLGGTTPRFFSPCGTALDSARPQLYRVTKPYYDYLGIQAEPISDGILIPWETGDMRGTLWCVSHRNRRAFDFTDYNLLDGLASFAAIAVRNSFQQKQLREQETALAAAAATNKLTTELEQRNFEVLEQAEQLRDLSVQLMHTQDEERRHIARELHDSAGQNLTSLGIFIAQLTRKLSERAPELLQDAELCGDLISALNTDIRTASYLAHPPLLDEAGFVAALRMYCEGLAERSNFEVAVELGRNFGRLAPDLELVLFRVVQECLTNVIRHSGTASAYVWIGGDGKRVQLEIQDTGRGIPPAKLAEIQQRGGGVGFRGMRERLRQFRGELKVESNPSGTRVLIEIPV